MCLTHVYTLIRTTRSKNLIFFQESGANTTDAGSILTGCAFPLFPLLKTKGFTLTVMFSSMDVFHPQQYLCAKVCTPTDTAKTFSVLDVIDVPS